MCLCVYGCHSFARTHDIDQFGIPVLGNINAHMDSGILENVPLVTNRINY